MGGLQIFATPAVAHVRTPQEAIEVFFNNPCRFFGQCPKWKVKPIGA